MPRTRIYRVLIVDDDPFVLSSLRQYFEITDDIHVVAEASNGVEALEQLRRRTVDIVLADIHMPSMDGVTLLSHVKELPNPPVFLALTAFDSDKTMLQVLKNGGAGYVLKSQKPRAIVDAVYDALEGGKVVSPQAMGRLVQYLDDERPPAPVDPVQEALKLQTLSDPERRILPLLCQGLSNQEIADRLSYSQSTVKKHVSNIMEQFGATSRLNLVAGILANEYRI